jgi:hypothetical protein
MVPPFLLFAAQGDPGRGRAAAIFTGVSMTAIRACWDLRKRVWFLALAGIMIMFHAFFIVLVPWTAQSYPGYALLPVAVVDFGIVYGSFKLAEKIMK